jgi:hypothetical protein
VNIDSTPRNVEATNNEDVTEIAAPESEERKRPQGVKKAKEALSEELAKLAWKLWTKCGLRRRHLTWRERRRKRRVSSFHLS